VRLFRQFPFRSSGTGRGERALVGPQTSGRAYRNLSQPEFGIRSQFDLPIKLRDGVTLLADLYRPDTDHPVPLLVAVCPYPRQVQHLSAPLAFVEAGQTDFWVPRGYAHLIVNLRGTFGSGGEYVFFDPKVEHDLYDVIEWAAQQTWCDGSVGMIGVSYFAIEQYHAALAKPPHLKAIFPFSGATDLYRNFAYHGGIFSGRFFGAYFNAVGSLERFGSFFRGPVLRLLNNLILHRRAVHRRFWRPLKAPMDMLERACRFPYGPSWEANYQAGAREHQLYDDFWAARDVTERIVDINIPMYLGSDPQNVTVHADGPFTVLPYLRPDQAWRIIFGPPFCLQWPWESLHVEALAWYDHWLKGRDTGIMEGPRIRYYVEGAGEWRATDVWPPQEVRWSDRFLGADGTLCAAAASGSREYAFVSPIHPRPRNTRPPALPAELRWESAPVTSPVEIVGPSVLHLVASSTATDADWIVKLCDLAPDGTAFDLTQGWLRASHRALEPQRSTPHRPVHRHTAPEALEPGKRTEFAVAILPIAHRLKPGHRLQLRLASSDRGAFGAMQGQEHVPLGFPSHNVIFGASRLRLPIVAGEL
jgi:predicted acyl esterase